MLSGVIVGRDFTAGEIINEDEPVIRLGDCS